MNSTNKKNQFVWAQTVTIYGSKITLHTTNFRKSWGLKFYEAFRYGKSLKFQVANSALPNFLKLFIGLEMAVWLYSKVIKDKLEHIQIEGKAKSDSINEKIKRNFLYQFFEKEKHSDYLANIIIYALFGRYFYYHNRKLAYSIFAAGGIFSVPIYFINNKAKKFSEEKLKIEEFNLYSTQFNLIPKILLTSSILKACNFFFKENAYLIRNTIPMNHKMIYIYFFVYLFSKFSRSVSHFTHDILNLKNFEAAASWLISALLIRWTLFPSFILIHYFNPYSFIVWIGAKNNTEDNWVQENYSKKSILYKLKTYLIFISTLSVSNMLNIYF